MNISLTPELEKFVKDKVESGQYHSMRVIREGLGLLAALVDGGFKGKGEGVGHHQMCLLLVRPAVPCFRFYPV